MEYHSDNKTLSIGTAGNGAMDDYSDETPPAWYAYKDEIKTVEIYGNITKIGANAFKILSAVTDFYIEGSIQREVGDGAFTGTIIKTIQLPVHAMPVSGHILFSVSTEINESGVKSYINGDTLNYAFIKNYRAANEKVPADKATLSYSPDGGGITYLTNGGGITYLTNITGDFEVTAETVTQYTGTNVVGEGLTYSLNDTGESAATYESLSINGYGAMYDFESADSRPDEIKNHASEVTRIYIGEVVTHIGSHAFEGMSSLSEVVIKSPNVTIAHSAFSNSKMHVCLVKIPEEVFIAPEGPNSQSYKNCQIAGTYSAKNSDGENEYGKYIAFEKRYTITLDMTTPLGYALVGKDGNTLERTIQLNKSTSTYNLAGTCEKVWEKISDYNGTTYVIKDKAGLQLIADTTNKNTRIWEDDPFSYLNSYEGKNFRLDADIDWCGTINFFNGDFDGNGHTVKASGSLFNNFGGTISNLTISENSTNANFVNENKGTIDNCTNNSTITNEDNTVDNFNFVGGIAGRNNGSISNCENSGKITGTTTDTDNGVGGIVGLMVGGSVSENFNSSEVTGNDNIGGIVGNNNGSQYFSSNVNNAEVTGTGENPSYIGGVAEITAENLRDISVINNANVIASTSGNVTAENLDVQSRGYIGIYGGDGVNNISVNGAEVESNGVIKIGTDDGGNDTISVKNIDVKGGGILHSFGYGDGTNSNFAIANVEGANNTISVDGVTLDNTNYHSQIGNWNSADETISVNNVSVNGAAMLLVAGGNGDSISISDVKLTAATDYGLAVYHNGSEKISVNDVSMSGDLLLVNAFG